MTMLKLSISHFFRNLLTEKMVLEAVLTQIMSDVVFTLLFSLFEFLVVRVQQKPQFEVEPNHAPIFVLPKTKENKEKSQMGFEWLFLSKKLCSFRLFFERPLKTPLFFEPEVSLF